MRRAVRVAVLAAAACGVASTAVASVDTSLFFINATNGALVAYTKNPISSSKTIEMYSNLPETGTNNTKFEGNQFQLFRYYCALCSGESYPALGVVGASTIPALKNAGVKGYVSSNSFTLNAVVKADEQAWNNYYWFKQLDSNGNVVGQSAYVLVTDKISSSMTVGAKIGGEASGAIPGLAQVKGNGEVNTQQQSNFTGVDPSEDSVIAFVPLSLLGSTTTDATGLWDPVAQRFVVNTASQWDELIADFTTAPAGWSFGFDRAHLSDSDFVSAGPDVRVATNNLLFSSTAPSGSLVVYEVLNEFTYPDGSVSYFAQPTLAAQVVPEPATWAMLILGLGLVGFALRRRRAAVAA